MNIVVKAHRWNWLTALIEGALGFATVAARTISGVSEANHFFSLAAAIALANCVVSATGYLGAGSVLGAGLAGYFIGSRLALFNPDWVAAATHGHPIPNVRLLGLAVFGLLMWGTCFQLLKGRNELPLDSPSEVKSKGDLLKLTEEALAEVRQLRVLHKQGMVIGSIVFSLAFLSGAIRLIHMTWPLALALSAGVGVGVFYFVRWASQALVMRLTGQGWEQVDRFERKLEELHRQVRKQDH